MSEDRRATAANLIRRALEKGAETPEDFTAAGEVAEWLAEGFDRLTTSAAAEEKPDA